MKILYNFNKIIENNVFREEQTNSFHGKLHTPKRES